MDAKTYSSYRLTHTRYVIALSIDPLARHDTSTYHVRYCVCLVFGKRHIVRFLIQKEGNNEANACCCGCGAGLLRVLASDLGFTHGAAPGANQPSLLRLTVTRR